MSSDDIAAAARALPLLEVARAWVSEPGLKSPRTGVVTLVAMRSRPSAQEPEQPPETARWLETIRRRLAPRLLLGSRLVVVAPRYIDFSIDAIIEANPGTNPSVIKDQIMKELRKRLALFESVSGEPVRQPGVPVTPRDVNVWVRAAAGVRRVVQLDLRGADGRILEKVAVPRNGLPRWREDPSTIDVGRPDTGRPR